jgi:uncharacterized membrane protein YfcA
MTLFGIIDPAFVASGFGVGFLVGMTGVGGGSLMTPLLVLLFGLDARVAVGTDLLYASITKAGGSLVHGSGGTVDWRIAGRLAAGSLPAAVLTIAVLYALGPTDKYAAEVISLVLGGALIVTAVCVFARPLVLRLLKAAAPAGLFTHRVAATIAFGALLGVLVSISSVGAGAIGMTVLVFLYPEAPTVRLVGSDIAHAVPLTLVAGLGHWLFGSVDWAILVSLLVGSLPGITFGSRLAARVPDIVLRPALAATLAIIGIRLLA